MTTEPQPSPWQSLLTGTARAGTNLLTFPLGMGQLLAHGIQAVTPLKIAPGRDEAATNLLNSVNQFTRFGTAAPTDLTNQVIEAAPSIAVTPGLLHKALGVAQFGLAHGGEIRDTLKPEASQAAEGYATAAAGGEAQPLGVPQAPSTSTSIPPPQTPGVAQSQSGSGSRDAPRPQAATPFPQSDDYDVTLSKPQAAPQYEASLGPAIQTHTVDNGDFTVTFSQPVSDDVARTNAATGSVDDTDGQWEWYAGMAGLLGLGIGGVAAGVKMARNARAPMGEVAGKVYPSIAREPVPSVTEGEVSTFTPPGQSNGFMTQAVDRMNPARDAVKEVMPPGPQREKVLAQISTSSNHAIDSMTEDFFKTGRFPGSTIRTTRAPIAVLKDVSKLPPEKQTALNEVLTLNRNIDISRNQGMKPWGVGTSQLSYTDMVNKRNSLLNTHNDLVPLVEDYHNLFRSVPKYAEQEGVIDSATRQKLETANPNFAPMHREYNDTFFQKMFGKGKTEGGNTTDTSFLDFPEVGELTTEALRPGEPGHATHAAVDYLHQLITAVTINRARLAVGEGVSTGAKPTVSFLSKAPTDPMAKAIPVYRQGTKQWMTTDDYALYSALQYRPRTGFQTMQTINKLRAMTYTGNLNPMAAFRIASYDAVMAPSMMPKSTSLGPLTQAVDTVGEVMKTLGVTQGQLKTPEALARYDPTNLLAPVWGTGRGIWSDMAYSMHRRLDSSLQQNGVLTKTFGAQNVSSLSKMMSDAFERSTASLAERYGAISGNRYAMLDDGKSTPEILASLPGFRGLQSSFATLPGVNMANSALDAVRESVRLQFMSSNIKRVPTVRRYTFQVGTRQFDVPVVAWEPKGDLTVTAGQTRRLMGDPAEIGGDVTTKLGRKGQQYLSTVLYGNQSIQTTAQIFRMAADHPGGFIATQTALNMGGVASWQWAMNQPEVKRQLDGMTPEQRSRVIPIAFNNKLYGFIGVPPEMRPIFGAALHGYLGATGQLAKGEFEAGDTARVAMKAVTNDYLPNAFDPLAIYAAPLGKHMDPNSLALVDQPVDEMKAENDPDYKDSAQAHMDNLIQSIAGMPVQAGYNAIKSWFDARTQNMGLKNPAYATDKGDVAAKKFFEPFIEPKQLGPLNQLWGLGTDVKAATGNLAYEKVWRDTMPNLKKILKEAPDQLKSGGTRILSGLATAQGVTGLIPNQQGDMGALKLYTFAKALDGQLKPMRDEYHQLTISQDNVTVNPVYADPKKRIIILNTIAAKKASLNEQMLAAIRAMEHEAGVSFSQ
jgi:hypothetical protein